MPSTLENIQFETVGPVGRAVKKLIVNPMANYLPADWVKGILRFGKSELALANWADPGGWRSMVISYEGDPRQVADRVLVKGGTIPMALRNRRRLGAALIAELIEAAGHDNAHVLCIGAGPGHIVTDAMNLAEADSHATLLDISSEAFDYGHEVAQRKGLSDRVRFVQGDARDVETVRALLDCPPDVVKMLGICEYLDDRQILDIAKSVYAVMPEHGAVVFNSLSDRHGTNRFFHRVFGLYMNHRSPERLEALFREAGFVEFRRHVEPLGVYHVIVGRKASVDSGNQGSP